MTQKRVWEKEDEMTKENPPGRAGKNDRSRELTRSRESVGKISTDETGSRMGSTLESWMQATVDMGTGTLDGRVSRLSGREE